MSNKVKFKVGDKVGIAGYGGPYTLEKVSCSNANKYSLMARGLTFMEDGREYAAQIEPVLYHWDSGHGVDAGDEPERLWTPKKPTWCWVEGNKRLIMRRTCRGFFDVHGAMWTLVAPCEPEDIPEWWPKEWE